MNFREFSEAYNDYLMHEGISIAERAKGKKKPSPYSEASTRDWRLVARYVTDPAMKEVVLNGQWLHSNFVEALAIAKGGYNDETKSRMIMQLIRDPRNKEIFKNDSLSHNDFREYSDYLMHYGRKGMKWGKAIYQDDYDPVGQEARGNNQGGSHNDTVGRLARAGQYLTNPIYDMYQAGRYIANNSSRTENRINDTVKPATGRQNPNAAQNAQREQSMQSGRETMNNLYNQAGQGRSDLTSSYNNVMNGYNTAKDKKHFTPRERQQLENDWNDKINQMMAGLKRAKKQRANYKKGPSPEEQLFAKLEQGFAQLQQNAQDRKTDTEIERGILAMQNFLKDPSNFQRQPNKIEQLLRELSKAGNRDPKGKS